MEATPLKREHMEQRTEKFLIQFLSNLLLNGDYALKNRELHILHDTENKAAKGGADTVNDTVFSLLTCAPTLF
jgi:hypothetical protein